MGYRPLPRNSNPVQAGRINCPDPYHRVSQTDQNSPIKLLFAYISIYRMVKTIRVSEEYHEWLSAHKKSDETMEETLRRMTRGPHPSDVAGLLTEAEAEDAKEAVKRLRGRSH